VDAAALLRTLTIVRNGGLRLSPYSPQSTQMLSTRLALGSVRLRVLRAFSSVQFLRGRPHAHSTTVSTDGSAPLGQHKY
jgi:hypothetical protein